MRILLDECVDQRFRRTLSAMKSLPFKKPVGRQEKWSAPGPGREDLPSFITVDRNLYFQQNLSNFNIAVLVLVARTNRLADLRPLAKDVLSAMSVLKPGQVSIIPKESR